MQKKKTRFEQVPIEVAEIALQQQIARRRTSANESISLRNSLPIRAGLRRFLHRRPYRQSRKDQLNLTANSNCQFGGKITSPGKLI